MYFKFHIGDRVRFTAQGLTPAGETTGVIVHPVSKYFYLVCCDATNNKVEAYQDEITLVKRHRLSIAQKGEMESLWRYFEEEEVAQKGEMES